MREKPFYKFRKGLKIILFRFNCYLQKSRKKKCYITCAGNSDGVGAQSHAILSTFLFSKLYNIEYVHTPFNRIQHNHKMDPEWERKWEDFFSFRSNIINAREILNRGFKEITLRHPLLLFKKNNYLFSVRNCHECTDLVPDRYNLIMKKIRSQFRERHITSKLRNREFIKIALHIRRGDVSNEGLHADRFTDPETLNRLLEVITSWLHNNNFKFEIDLFSQGSEEEFSALKHFNPNLKLNQDEFETFISLVDSDVLVTAKSSFSYTAALLCEGLIFYDKFWHNPLENWINFQDANRNEIQNSLAKNFQIIS